MPIAYASAVIPASAGDVWAAVRDFGDLSWLPGSGKTEILDGKAADQLGAVRSVAMPNGAVRERLVTMSDFDRSYTYLLLDNPPGLALYRSTLSVKEVTDGNHAFVEWAATIECDVDKVEAFKAGIVGGIYKPGLDALKAKFAK
ncbi:polyketide cyclase/dehydrase [Hyaloraphidium curvatum]|nr:polyketide cyclase/dehydrase [Hyaloraphidium curvatum]